MKKILGVMLVILLTGCQRGIDNYQVSNTIVANRYLQVKIDNIEVVEFDDYFLDLNLVTMDLEVEHLKDSYQDYTIALGNVNNMYILNELNNSVYYYFPIFNTLYPKLNVYNTNFVTSIDFDGKIQFITNEDIPNFFTRFSLFLDENEFYYEIRNEDITYYSSEDYFLGKGDVITFNGTKYLLNNFLLSDDNKIELTQKSEEEKESWVQLEEHQRAIKVTITIDEILNESFDMRDFVLKANTKTDEYFGNLLLVEPVDEILDDRDSFTVLSQTDLEQYSRNYELTYIIDDADTLYDEILYTDFYIENEEETAHVIISKED